MHVPKCDGSEILISVSEYNFCHCSSLKTRDRSNGKC